MYSAPTRAGSASRKTDGPQEKGKPRESRGLPEIGAPGFEPGTSPTRITGKHRVDLRKDLQIAACKHATWDAPPLGPSEFAVDSVGLGTGLASVPNRKAKPEGSLVIAARPCCAAARAAAHVPNRLATTLAAGHRPLANRSSASPPRRPACVRDQSYEDGSRPQRSRHCSIAEITSSGVHHRWIAPGWHRSQ
jgi:hypothetical protein